MVEAIAHTSIADKLAQRIKDSELGTFIDGDDLDNLARQAIVKAFFEDRTTHDGYRRLSLPPLVVEMATEQFKTAINARLKPVIDALVQDSGFAEMLLSAVSANIPKAAQDCAQSIMYGAISAATDQFNHNMPEKLRDAVTLALTPR